MEYRDGTRYKKSFGRGPDAEELAKDTAERVNLERLMEKRGLLQTPTGTRFEPYAALWLRTVIEPHKKSATALGYAQILRDHLNPGFGGYALAEITPLTIKAFIAEKLLEANPGRRGGAGRRKARNTVRNMVALLRAILNHAVEVDELLQTNPAAKFGKRFFEGEAAARGIEVEIYEEAEVAKILASTAALRPDCEIYVRTLFFTGLRIGELLGLQWTDFDPRHGVIWIRRKVRVRKGELVIETPKNGKGQPVDMPVDLMQRWQDLRAMREAEALVAGRDLSPWCCPSATQPATRPLNAGWFSHNVWHRASKAADLRRLRVHDARHTYAALSIRQGKPLDYVQRQLRHADISTTIRFYAHFKPGVLRHHANDFEERIRAHEEAE
jgi:integrase